LEVGTNFWKYLTNKRNSGEKRKMLYRLLGRFWPKALIHRTCQPTACGRPKWSWWVGALGLAHGRNCPGAPQACGSTRRTRWPWRPDWSGQRWPYQRQDSDDEGPNRGHHDGEGGEANPFWGIAHPGSYRMRPVAGSLSGGREGSDLRGRAVG
jgi:hypothetical protein